MKAAIVIACDIFTAQSFGGKQCALSHLSLLQQVLGKENVRAYSFSINVPAVIPEGMVVYPAFKNNLSVAFAALRRRKVISLSVEKTLYRDLQEFAPDILWIDSSQLGRLLRHRFNIPTVVFFHNVEQMYAKNKVVHEGLVYLPSFWASRYNETLATQLAQTLVCLNERDSATLKQLYGRDADAFLPINFTDSFDDDKRKSTVPQPKQLLFVGSNFPPNVKGITWFVENVMPDLPDFTLLIVGRGFETLRGTLQQSNVTVLGGVDELSPYYYASAAMVMPILYGDGMKVKTAEAMMYGKTIFATDEALEGYDVDNISGIIRCNTEKAFVSAIVNFFNSSKCSFFQPDVRELFLKKYETGVLRTQMEELLRNSQTDREV